MPDAPAIEIRRDVVYGTVDDQELALDLYLPAVADPPRPGMVFIHGGGWHAGHRQQFAWHAEHLARRGYVAISASYRLTGVAPYPACFDDCQRAVRWLRAHAAEFHLDPQRLGACGSSAGGHLVALLGTRDTRDDSVPELAGLSSRVPVVVDYHGVHDFPALPESELTTETRSKLFRGALADRRALWEDASPARFVDADAAATLLVHDPHDTVVPFDQSVRFAHALLHAGRPVQLLPVPGASHGFIYNHQNAWAQRTWPLAVAWLDYHLRPGGEG